MIECVASVLASVVPLSNAGPLLYLGAATLEEVYVQDI